jgi:hypothetical protein
VMYLPDDNALLMGMGRAQMRRVLIDRGVRAGHEHVEEIRLAVMAYEKMLDERMMPEDQRQYYMRGANIAAHEWLGNIVSEE